jgi:1,4-dihydroxy-2-naphthoate octaprenyltransferase
MTAARPDLTLAQLWPLIQPASLVVTVAACVLGLASAAACGHGPDWAGALAALLLACGFHASANLLQQRPVAVPGSPARPWWLPGCSHDPAPLNTADPQQLRQLAWAVLGLVLLAGTWLAVRAGGGLMLLGMAGLTLLWAGTQAPLHLGQRGLGALAAAVGWWLAVLGADYVQRRHFFLIPAVTAVSFALLVANTHLACTLVARHDAVRRRATHQGLAGQGATGLWLLYGGLLLAAHGWLAGGVAALYQPEAALWGLVSLPVALGAWAQLRQGRTARRAVALSTLAALLHALAMALGLLLGAVG